MYEIVMCQLIMLAISPSGVVKGDGCPGTRNPLALFTGRVIGLEDTSESGKNKAKVPTSFCNDSVYINTANTFTWTYTHIQ